MRIWNCHFNCRSSLWTKFTKYSTDFNYRWKETEKILTYKGGQIPLIFLVACNKDNAIKFVVELRKSRRRCPFQSFVRFQRMFWLSSNLCSLTVSARWTVFCHLVSVDKRTLKHTRLLTVNCFILMFLQLGIGDANQEQCKEQQPGVLHGLEWVSGECHQIISPCPQ